MVEVTMEELPWGYRVPEDLPLFRTRIDDPTIEPDRVSPSIEGYFRIPAVWIGDEPHPSTVRVLNPSVHHQIVLRKKLRCGIEARVRRDGTFLFDFSAWPLAPTIIIPGFRKPSAPGPHRIPRETSRAEEKAESHAVLRAQVMNAHQACLTTSESVVKRRGAMTGFPITAWNTHKAITFDTAAVAYHDDTEDLHALAQNVLNNKDQVGRQNALQRRVLELDVVDHSLDMLDTILSGDDATLVQLIEAAYMAACRMREKRFGEAVILAWGVCEQLVSLAWNELLEDAKSGEEVSDRMSKDRRDKLTGRDYTASIMVEMLEINGRIDRDLYRLLEVARKARNNWAHRMRPPKEREVSVCIRAVQNLLQKVKGIPLVLQSGGRGGVPQWPVWMWEQVKEEGGP
jgi:hypothetical protein